LLVDHRECLVRIRTALNNDLLWHLHDLWPEQTLPGGALLSKKWITRMAGRLARAEQIARVRIARDELRHMRELSRTIDALETEIAGLVAEVAPQPSPARPRRQPPDQYRHPPHRRHPRPLSSRDPRLRRSQMRRRQDPP
jgi:hypothetical protein